MSDEGEELAHGAELSLTVATVAGLCLALLDRFFLKTSVLETSGLVVSYATGAAIPARTALIELFSRGRLDIDLLMVLAAIAAAVVGAPLEGAILLVLFSISGTLEHRAMGKARRAVEALMALRPEVAMRQTDSGIETVPVAALRIGDKVILQPGSRVPVDGILAQGTGSLDESTITGESLPVTKSPGAQLHEATVNLNAVLVMTVSRSLEESTVAQMVRMVTEAQATKAPSERFSSWFGERYTWFVLGGSIAAYVIFLLIGLSHTDALYRAATLLVAASPCAVVISVPAAILSALSAAARGGVLFKGGAALEQLAETRIFAFDKTGTLTTGKAEVSEVRILAGSEVALIALAAGLERHSEHPIASAILREAASRDIQPALVVDVVSEASRGISGFIAGERVWAGNPRMIVDQGASHDHPDLRTLHDGSQTVVYLGRGNTLLGAIAMADEARETSRRGLDALRRGGVERIIMMTGDRKPVAERIGAEMGISEIHADLLPADKVDLVDALAKSARVAFVGDGINDAAALARSDVGIAMGVAGSEVALQAADVALLSDDMARLAEARRLAIKTRSIIRQNLVFALGAMAVLVIGGAFFELPLPLAVIGHEGGTLLVVMNGLRLLWDPIRAK